DELVAAARQRNLLAAADRGPEAERFAAASMKVRLGQDYSAASFPAFGDLRAELEKPFRESVIFWRRTGGPKGDLVDDEMGRVLQVPGWVNIFTQPIINRIEMLSTGVRTEVGIKVFGPDLDTIERVCRRVEAVVQKVPGARHVVANQVFGKGYVDVTIDRVRAA